MNYSAGGTARTVVRPAHALDFPLHISYIRMRPTMITMIPTTSAMRKTPSVPLMQIVGRTLTAFLLPAIVLAAGAIIVTVSG